MRPNEIFLTKTGQNVKHKPYDCDCESLEKRGDNQGDEDDDDDDDHDNEGDGDSDDDDDGDNDDDDDDDDCDDGDDDDDDDGDNDGDDDDDNDSDDDGDNDGDNDDDDDDDGDDDGDDDDDDWWWWLMMTMTMMMMTTTMTTLPFSVVLLQMVGDSPSAGGWMPAPSCAGGGCSSCCPTRIRRECFASGSAGVAGRSLSCKWSRDTAGHTARTVTSSPWGSSSLFSNCSRTLRPGPRDEYKQ